MVEIEGVLTPSNSVAPKGVEGLSEAQAAEMRRLIKPYLDQIQALKQQMLSLQIAANTIGTAYLRGAGVAGEVHIHIEELRG